MNERFQRSIAEGTSKDDVVFGIWMHCWHEPEVTQLLTDLVANWALWTRPAWRVSFPVVAVCAVWLVAACFFSCTAVGRAVPGQGAALGVLRSITVRENNACLCGEGSLRKRVLGNAAPSVMSIMSLQSLGWRRGLLISSVCDGLTCSH